MASCPPPRHYLNDGYGVRSWLLTRDHKRIALLYLAAVTFFFFVGGAFAVLIRLELATPAGDLVSDETYNKLFTMHGVMMVFFFLIPAIPAVLGNFLVPIMIGAKDLAFPKLNLASWYIFMIGATFTTVRDRHRRRSTPAGRSTRRSAPSRRRRNVIPAALGIFITGFSSILTGLNFIVTIHRMRAPGHDLVPAAALHLVALRDQPDHGARHAGDRHHASCWSRPSACSTSASSIRRVGGDPVLFQHLFWFYSHPAVYIMVLPAMGVISELIAAFCRKQVFGYTFVAFSSLAIAVLGFLVWGHHMFVAGQSVYAALVFSILSFLVAIPSAVKVFNWTATMYKGSISWETPMLYAIGFIGLFTIGGLTGLFLAAVGLDVHVTDTYFVVAHFHYIMVGGTIMAYLGGLHYWWPKITGRDVQRAARQGQRGHHLRRLQPDVLPAVHPRLPRHAAALSRLSAGVSGAERAVVGRRVDPRRRLPDPDGLPGLVAAVRQDRRARTRGAPSAWNGRRRRRRRPRISRRRRS